MSYQPYKHKKESIEEKIVIGILKFVWWLVTLPFKLIFKLFSSLNKDNSKKDHYEAVALEQSFVRGKWQEIMQFMSLGKPSNYQAAVLEADKLLDHVLKGLRSPGLTMADRLKSARNRFTGGGYEAAWQGHKVRNELVHNSQYAITDFMAKSAIENYEKAIKELINI